jgi:histidine triad (HIT) family protein
MSCAPHLHEVSQPGRGYPPRVPSIFSRIVAGEIPAHRLSEDDRFLAFLDVRPIRPGHSLVVPKEEIDHFFDLPDGLLADLMVFAKPVANAIRSVTGAARVGCAVVGVEVPHAHLHLIPVDGVGDLDFRKASEAGQDDLAAMAERIRAQLSG